MFNIDAILMIAEICTPIAVAYIGIRSERANRENKKFNDMRAELERAEKEKAEKEKNDLKRSLTQLHTTVVETNKKLNEIDDKVKKIENRVADNATDNQHEIKFLKRMLKFNAACTKASTKLVTVLAEGMRDEHLDGNITAAIAEYRKFESESMTKIYDITDEDDI